MRHDLVVRLGFAVASLALPAASDTATDPWSLLAAVRDRLAAQPVVADFDQTFLPAGFTSGETESGAVAMALPDLVRWDYRDPFPRTFLVQGETVFTWNQGEATGRQFSLAADEARHLDLLRLEVDELRARYTATRAASDGTEAQIELTPPSGAQRLAAVTITVSLPDLLPVGIATRDLEGNLTSFALRDFRPLDRADLFVPPAGIEWLTP